MSLLDRVRPRSARGGAAAAGRRTDDGAPWTAGLFAGLQAAILSLVALVLVLLLAWATSAQTTATWGQATRVGAEGWLLLHRTGIDVGRGHIGTVPLGLVLLPGGVLWFSGRRVAASAGRGARALVRGVAALVVGYTAVAAATALLSRSADGRPVLWQAVAGAAVLSGLAGGGGALRARPGAWAALLARVPDRVRRAVAPAVLAVALLAGAAAVLLAVVLAVEHDRVLTLHRALQPGAVGGAVLTVAQLAVMPNLVLWVVAWLAGPGFAIGVGTSVTPAASDVGLLPLVPVLGGLPSPGALPWWMSLAVLLPVLVGVVAGWVAAGRAPEGAGSAGVVVESLTAAVLATGGLTVLLALSGGAMGPARMAAVGPSAWRTGLVLLGELGVGAALAGWLRGRRR